MSSSDFQHFNQEQLNEKLFGAVTDGSYKEVEKWIEAGASTNATDGSKNRQTCLHRAVVKNRLDVAELLIKHDAEIDAKTIKGFTPLFLATCGGLPLMEPSESSVARMCHLLLDHGADPNALSASGSNAAYGKAPLHMAAEKAKQTVCELLLGAGADPSLEDGEDEKTPRKWYSLGIGFDHGPIHDVLVQHENLPFVPLDQLENKAQLFEKNERGECALDNPLTWRFFGDVCKKLDKAGEHFDKDELLARGDGNVSYLTRATDARALPQVIAHFNHHGEYLRMAELDNAGVIDATAVSLSYVLHRVIGLKNLGGSKVNSFNADVSCVPPVECADILLNLHRLRALMRDEERLTPTVGRA